MHINNIRVLARNTPEISEYSIAEEKRLQGAPRQRLENHYSSPCEQFHTGIWQSETGAWKVDYTEHEYCEILEGNSVISDEQGNRLEVGPGDRFVIPAGFGGSWQVTVPCRKLYVVFESNR